MTKYNNPILSHDSKLFDVVNRIFDIAILGGALTVAHRLEGNAIWNLTGMVLFLFTVIYFELCGTLAGLYVSHRSYSTLHHLRTVAIALLGTFVLLAMTTSFSNSLHNMADRAFMLKWLAISGILLCGGRLLLRQCLILVRSRGYNIRTVGIAGCTPAAQTLARKMHTSPWMGFVIDGVYDNALAEVGIAECGGLPVKGSLSALVANARAGYLDQVYIAMPMSQEEEISELVNALADTTATVMIIPDVFTFELMNARQVSIDGIPAISIYDTPFNTSDLAIKTAFDVLFSLIILTLLALPMMLIAAAVKLSSPGPAIFRQRRYGLDGKAIDVWKFRTMTVMDNGGEVRQATRNDSRITPIGAFLRRTSLDELPQFINVLQGTMSIVGPRPHAIAHNEEYRKLIKGYMLRHKVKPGITGWAQVNGWRGETDTLEKMEKRVEFDLEYIRNWNIWLDMRIVLLTVIRGFTGKNVY